MRSDEQTPAASEKLIGDLTVADAQHILDCEGGKLTRGQYALQFVEVAAVAATTARAIMIGRATAWHLALPMVAQYAAVLIAVPIIYLGVRHPAMRKDTVGATRLWIGLAAAAFIATAIRSWLFDLSWREQIASDAHVAW